VKSIVGGIEMIFNSLADLMLTCISFDSKSPLSLLTETAKAICHEFSICHLSPGTFFLFTFFLLLFLATRNDLWLLLDEEECWKRGGKPGGTLRDEIFFLVV
jgi:hypothetical protein